MTRQQEWALRAQQQVRDLAATPQRKKHKTFGMKMPGLIQQSGLVQALVFVQTRTGEGGPDFVDALATVYGVANGNALVTASRTADLAQYLALTRDVSEVAIWVRRFVQIEMGDLEAEG